MRLKIRAGMAAVGIFAAAGSAQAGEVSITQSRTNGVQSATATFTFNDDGPSTILTVQLTNTMSVTGDGTNPQWLQGVFFDIAGSPTMTYDPSGLAATMVTVNADGSTTPYSTVTADHFWGLRQDLTSGELPFGTQQYGLSAAGFGVFGESSVLNLQAGGPMPQLDGSDGGILSDTVGSLFLPGGHQGRPMMLGSLWLTFDLGDYDINSADVAHIMFVFGTDFNEIVLVPVPLALPLGLAGLAGIVCGRRRLARLVTA